MLGFGALGKFALGETAPTYGVGFSGSTVYWKYASDAATTNATGYNLSDADRLYAVTLIQGSAPTAVNTTITVPTDDLVFSSSAATVVRTANIAVTVPQGNLVEDGKVPTVFTTARTAVTPLQGNAAFSSVAPTLSILTVLTIPQGNLAFSPTVPTVVTTANIARTIPQGNLAFSPTVPAVNTRFNITVPQGNLVEDGKVPLVQILSNIIVPQGNAAFSPTVPTVFTSNLIARTPPQGNIVFSTVAPAVRNRNAFISFTETLAGTFAHAEGKTLRQKLDPSLLNPLVGGIQISLQFSAPTNGSILAAYVGHAAATGDGFDFDGNQQQLLFSGSGTRSVTGATTVVSDPLPLFAYDETKPLIVSAAFGGTRVDLAMYGSGVTLETETTAWIAAVVAAGGTVSSGRQVVVNDLVLALKGYGLWTKLDRLKLLAAENLISALVDLIGLDLATAVNSPTFTVDRGFASDGSTSYIDSNYNPTVHAVNYNPSGNVYQGMIAVWDNTSRAVNGTCQTGSYIWPSQIDIYTRANIATGSDTYFHVNSSGYEGIQSFPIASSQGLFAAQTSQFTANYSDNELYRNGSLVGTGAITYGYYGSPNQNIWILAQNYGGSINAASTDELSVWLIGAPLTSTEHANLNTALAAYRTALGM